MKENLDNEIEMENITSSTACGSEIDDKLRSEIHHLVISGQFTTA